MVTALSGSPLPLCNQSMKIFLQGMSDMSLLSPISRMLHYNSGCRTLAWQTFISVAPSLITKYPDNLDSILATFDGVFASGEEQEMVEQFLQTNNIDPALQFPILKKIFFNEQYINYNCCTKMDE